MCDLIGTGQAAKLLGVSSERVRQLVREGHLSPHAETSAGRIFDRADVEELRHIRNARRVPNDIAAPSEGGGDAR